MTSPSATGRGGAVDPSASATGGSSVFSDWTLSFLLWNTLSRGVASFLGIVLSDFVAHGYSQRGQSFQLSTYGVQYRLFLLQFTVELHLL